ncbi:MAG TPA: endonuclease/exonuclease/phosphatase family protein [Anaeromyxobacteraceae bacterium]|nr:endonuclease/exonuclease/phosphatase family protein [Anaeromyxobacteraceae bacterium]
MRSKAVVALLVLAGCGLDPSTTRTAADPASLDAALASVRHAARPDLRVMTRNLYLGADIVALASAQDPLDAIMAANAAWAGVQATRFPDRAEAIAREIDQASPDVIALQEVTTWRLDGEVYQDFLEILLGALERRGLHFEVAARITSMDAELYVGDPSDLATMKMLRYTDHDVILVRHGVAWRDAPLPPPPWLPGFIPAPAPVPPIPGDRGGALYAVALESGLPATAFFTVGGSTIFSWRGLAVTEVERGGRWVRVLATHVEDTFPSLLEMDPPLPPWLFQGLQDAQLVGLLGALQADSATALPTVVLGDFNVYVEPADPAPVTYTFLTGGDFPLIPELSGASPLRDAWTALHPDDWGFTWGFSPDLRSGRLSTRLDLVLSTSDVVPREIERTGVHERAPGGLHPSDHAGLRATLHVE